MDQVDSIKKKKKRKREDREKNSSAGSHRVSTHNKSDLKPKHKKSKHSQDPQQLSTPIKIKKKKDSVAPFEPSTERLIINNIKNKKSKEEKLKKISVSTLPTSKLPSTNKNVLATPRPKKKSKKVKLEKTEVLPSVDKKGLKKKKDKDKLKQTKLTESFLAKKAEGGSNKTDLQLSTVKPPSKTKSKSSDPSVKDIKKKSKKKENKVGGKKKNHKMDVEKASSNQKYNFGQQPVINVSDNSSDSTGLKIATNDDDESSEISSEYDSSDSEHIMKNIKSFNKKGASKSSAKKDDEPPPPKLRQKIYSSSDDEADSKDDDGDDEEDENDIKEEDEEEEDEKLIDELSGDENPKPDSEDVFFNGWTKVDVKQLLNRIQCEIPKNDNIKAPTRVKQLNWENIKFGNYTATQCLEKWKSIEKKIRGYRILQELLVDAQHWLEQPWTDFYKGNKKKYLRHPEMPKKPLTSYMIFYLKKKDKIAKEFPSLPLTDLSKVIAERFNKLAPNKKAKYNEMALQMKEDYMAKMKKFAEAHPAEMTRMYNNGGRTRRNQNALPGWSGGYKPVTPCRLFIEDKMKQHHGDRDANVAELQAEYREKWKTMNGKKKLPWIRWAHEAELKYMEELKAYQAENPNCEVPKYKTVLLKEERNLLEKMQGKPDKPPPSAYLLFSSVMLKDPNLRKLTPKERMQETARLWKNVPKVEKDGYNEKVKHLADVYKLEYASYLESLPEDKRREELANNQPKRVAKRKAKSTETSAKPAKKTKVEAKALSKKPRMSLEELLKKQPTQPPKDAYALFCQDYKDYPEKEIRKSWDALLEVPRNKLEARVEKLKQQYILDMRRFLKSLDPEDLQIYSAYKSNLNQSPPLIDVKLSESDCSDEEDDGSEEEVEDEEMEEEEEQKVDVSHMKLNANQTTPANSSAVKLESVKEEQSSDDSEDEEETEEKGGKSSSSCSSTDSSSASDEEGSSSSSSSSSSSEDEDGDNDAGAF